MQGMTKLEAEYTYQPVDTHDWLDAVGEFIDRSAGTLLEPKDMLGAFAIVGAETDLTDDEMYWAGYHLETFGFVRRQVIAQSWLARLFRRPLQVAYQLHLPERWSDEEIAGATAEDAA